MNFIDTHSHIYLSQFNEDLDECILRAQNEGVHKIILPNIDATSIDDNKQLSKKYPNYCYSLMGMHPTSVKADFKTELDKIIAELNAGLYCGVGEIGIDLYWDKTYVEEQKEVFRIQVQEAIKHNLPFVIHSRDSHNEVIEVLKKLNYSTYCGVFHAFMGSIEEANEIIELGFKIGIGGVVTFKNAQLSEVVKHIDLNHLVLETDSPYLTPHPNRGKRNESSYIPLIAQKIADLHSVKLAEVAEVTTNNALSVFKI